jgi:glycosyltransferase involved in cell wall biosynthesis
VVATFDYFSDSLFSNTAREKTDMKIDLHVHSKYSRRPSEWILKKIGCPESFTEPLHLYNIARERGMTHVTITDHNCIEGALAIGHLRGTFVSEEVTTYFPEDGCKLHVLAYNISEEQHRDIQKVRENVLELVPYLNSQNIFHVVAHPLYAVNDKLTATHFERMLLLFKNFEMNGARNHRENLQLKDILNSLTMRHINRLSEKHHISPLFDGPHEKRIFGGSDDHSGLNITRTHTEIKEGAVADFYVDRMLQPNLKVHIRPASPETMAHNIYSIAWQFYRSKFSLEQYAGKDALIRFLDRSLLSVNTDDHRILSRVYFFFNKRHHKKDKKQLSDSLPELLKYETNLLIEEHPEWLKSFDTMKDSLVEREQRWFELMNQLSSRVTTHFSDHLLDHLSGADVLNIFQTIGAAGGLYTLLAPYFIAYTQFTMGRELGREISERLGPGPIKNETNVDAVHVAHFTDTFYEVNGVALTLRQQVKLAWKNKKQYTLITCDATDRIPQQGVKHFKPIGTYDLPEYPEQKIFYPPFLEMLRYCHEKGFNQIQTATPGPIGLAALAIAKILKLPISGTYHTAIPQYAKILTGSVLIEEMAWKFILWYYDQLDVIYAPSESTKQELVQKGIKADKVQVYPRGIDVDQFHPSKRNGIFKKYPQADKRFKFLYVGRVSMEKNLDLLAQAFRRLAEQSPKVLLCIVGDGPYLQNMMAEVRDLPCVFTGYLKGGALSAVYASSDIFVFPSTTDTFGNVVLEAQASGLPVIVTDQGGPCENMVPGKTGLVVKGGSAGSLFQAMKSMTQHMNMSRKMGARARSYAEKRSFEAAFMQTWDMIGDMEASINRATAMG